MPFGIKTRRLCSYSSVFSMLYYWNIDGRHISIVSWTQGVNLFSRPVLCRARGTPGVFECVCQSVWPRCRPMRLCLREYMRVFLCLISAGQLDWDRFRSTDRGERADMCGPIYGLVTYAGPTESRWYRELAASYIPCQYLLTADTDGRGD